LRTAPSAGDPGLNSAARRRGAGHYAWLAAAAGIAISLAALGLFVAPSPSGHGTHTQLGLPPCWTMELFGIPCPGCGVTTSVVLAAHGELARSFVNQPFGCALALCMASFVAWAVWAQLSGRDLASDMRRLPRKRLLLAALAICAVAWIDKLATGF
jgi:hypothetical protein